jgi:hypothetical protein
MPSLKTAKSISILVDPMLGSASASLPRFWVPFPRKDPGPLYKTVELCVPIDGTGLHIFTYARVTQRLGSRSSIGGPVRLKAAPGWPKEVPTGLTRNGSFGEFRVNGVMEKMREKRQE